MYDTNIYKKEGISSVRILSLSTQFPGNFGPVEPLSCCTSPKLMCLNNV